MATYTLLLRNKGLLTLGLADVIATMGSWVTMMAVNALIIFERGGGIAESTGLFLAGMVPSMLLSPAAGWLCDRYDRRLLMVVSRVLSAAAVVGMMMVDQIGTLYVLLVVLSICTAVVTPARQSLVPDLVAPADLTHANALLHQLTGVVKTVAPMLAGGLLAFLRPQTAMAVDVVTYLLSAFLLYRLPAVPIRGQRTQPKGIAGPKLSMREVLRSVPVLRAIMPGLFVLPLVLIAFDLTLAVMVRDVLEAGITLKSVLIGLVGLGSVAGTFGLMLYKGEQRPGRDIAVGFLLLTAIPVACALGTTLGLPMVATVALMAACLLGGIGQGVAVVQIQTLMQVSSPPGWLGRLSGTMQSVGLAGQMIGLLLTPLLVPAFISLAGVYWVGSVIMIGVTLLTFTQVGRARYHEPIAQGVEAVE